MENNIAWMSGNFLTSKFRDFVTAKGLKRPSYRLIERMIDLEENEMTNRQKAILDLVKQFRAQREQQAQAHAA